MKFLFVNCFVQSCGIVCVQSKKITGKFYRSKWIVTQKCYKPIEKVAGPYFNVG